MNINIIFIACGLLVSAFTLLTIYKSRSRMSHKQLQGLVNLVHLRSLLEAIPQHRGMASAMLQGDESFRSKIATLQVKIDRDMDKMKTILSTKDYSVISERSTEVQSAWTSIKQQINAFSPSESFALHTTLMTQFLYLINDVADTSGLLRESDDNKLLIDAAINMLPMLTETLGQTRGMGTGAAASGKCNTDIRVKLRYLLNNSKHVINDVNQALKMALTKKSTQNDSEFSKHATQLLDDSQQATLQFLHLLETRIINDRKINIVPADFYASGTAAIQHSFTLLDAILGSLHNRLNLTVQTSQQRLWITRGTAIVLTVPGMFGLFQLFLPYNMIT